MSLYIPTELTYHKCNIWHSMTLHVLQQANDLNDDSVRSPSLSAGSASIFAGVAFGIAPSIPIESMIFLVRPVSVNSTLLLLSLLIRIPGSQLRRLLC